MEAIARQHKAEVIAVLAAICGLLPGRKDSTVDQDVAMAAEYLDAAGTFVESEDHE
jgi:hypothetical protein